MLYRMDLVEQIGSGIRRIMQLCHNYGVKIPQVVVEDNWVTVIFKRDQIKRLSSKNSNAGPVTGQVTEEIKKLVKICSSELSRSDPPPALRSYDLELVAGGWLCHRL